MKCKTKVWEAQPEYLLRRCEGYEGTKPVVDIDVMSRDESVKEPLAEMRLKQQGDHLAVSYISVQFEYRENKWGTRLYEEALRESCAVGKPLSSDTTRSEFSEAFWRKQTRKGRSVCLPGQARYWAVPRIELEELLDEGKITAAEYKKTLERLPEPPEDRDEDGDRVWVGCERYEMTRDPCPSGYSLAGLRKPRKPTAKKRRR